MLILLLALAPCPLAPRQEPPAVHVERDVPCRTVAGLELTLDAYLPPGPGPHPGIMLVHGGYWIYGDKRDMREFGERFAGKGYACFAPRYRLARTSPFPAQLEDCQYALQFVRAEAERFRVDPARIGGLGVSAGAHLLALLATLDERGQPEAADPVLRQSTRPQCVVDFCGPMVLARSDELGTKPPPQLFGDAPDSAYAAASPLNFVSADDAPFLLLHGDADERLPLAQSVRMHELLRAAGVRAELHVVPGGGHGNFLRTPAGRECFLRADRFLAEHLQAAGTPPR